jgi:hypothetical protein
MIREEAGFGDSEQQADNVEAQFSQDECLCAGNDPPSEHDPGDPAARAKGIQCKVARHLEEEVGEKENPGSSAEGSCGEIEVGAHCRSGEADIDPVQIGNEIAKHEKRYQPQGYLAHRRGFDIAGLHHPDANHLHFLDVGFWALNSDSLAIRSVT